MRPRPAVPCPLVSYHTRKDGPTITVCPSPAVTISHIKCLRSHLGRGRSLVRHSLLGSTPTSSASGSLGWGLASVVPSSSQVTLIMRVLKHFNETHDESTQTLRNQHFHAIKNKERARHKFLVFQRSGCRGTQTEQNHKTDCSQTVVSVK